MSIAYNGNIYRNLEEQVRKNQQDIADITEVNKLGIRVVGTASSASDLPNPDEYTGDYGDAFTVGQSAPYSIYVFTRAYVGEDTPHWFDLGPIMIVGPEGPEGPTGPQGEQGPRGTRWTASSANPQREADTITGDIHVNTSSGALFRFNGSSYVQVGNIKGPTGATGPTGPTGPQGPQGIQGIQGPQGVPGAAVKIVAIVSNTDQLPPPTESIRNNAYLVGTPGQYSIYIITGANNLIWENAGPFDLTDQIKAEALDAILTATSPIIKTNTGTHVNISLDQESLPKKYLHNICIQKNDSSNSKTMVGSFQIVNNSSAAISSLSELVTALLAQAPNTNDRIPCNIVYSKALSYSGNTEYFATFISRSTGDKFIFPMFTQTLTFSQSGSLYYGTSAWTTGGAIGIIDNVIEL